MRVHTSGSGAISASDEVRGGGMHPANSEILHITSGRVIFRWRDNLCEAHAPAVFVLPPSVPHELRCPQGEAKYRFWELSEEEGAFPLTEGEADAWNFRQRSRELYTGSLAASAIVQTLEFFFYLQAGKEDRPDPHLEEVGRLEIRKVYKLIAHLLDQDTAAGVARAGVRRKKREPRESVDLLIEYMDWKYKERITLESLADLVHMNPSYLVRLFRKHTGTTPFGYLRDLRLKAAASFLSGSGLPISVIVEETGFESVHYFSRLFKAVYGQSPAAWRRERREQREQRVLPGRTGEAVKPPDEIRR